MSTIQQIKKVNNPGGQATEGKEEWSEEQLEEALKHLKLLHIKVITASRPSLATSILKMNCNSSCGRY